MFAISLNPIEWVTTAAGAVADGVSSAVFDQAAEWVQGGLADIAGRTGEFLAGLGESNLGDETLMQLGGIFKWIALVTVVCTMMLGAASSLLGGSHNLSSVVREVPITLLMLAGWYSVLSLWLEGTAALTRLFLTDSLLEGLESGLVFDGGFSSFFVFTAAIALQMFLLIFLVEMLVLSHMLTLGAILGPVSIALRPWPSLRDVSTRMMRNLAALSLTPPLATASLAVAFRTLNEQGEVSFFACLGALAGLAVSILMPAMVSRFLPLGGEGGLGARGMIAAGVGTATVVAGAVVTGGAALGAAPGAMGSALGKSDE